MRVTPIPSLPLDRPCRTEPLPEAPHLDRYPTFEECRAARPDILWFIDPTDGLDDVDLTEPDGSAARPYPVAK